VSKANLRPILFSEALQRPTQHEFVELVIGLFQYEGNDQECLFARFRCTESGAVRTYGAYENDFTTRALFKPGEFYAH
jgi:hypothetical protein